MGRRRNEPVDVFKFIDMPPDGNPEPCWPWTGGVGGREGDQRGYFTIGGVKWLAYRLVYTLVYGEIPSNDVIRHKCDNGLCCNPFHLIVGNQSDNENDKYERDRWGFPMKIIEAIIDWDHKGMAQAGIAALVTTQFGIVVTQQRVSDIVTGARRKRQSELVRSKQLQKSNS